MTGPIQLPHFQLGNAAADLTSGAANFVTGMKAERDKRKADAMAQALLQIKDMGAQADLMRAGNAPYQPYLDDLRAKGMYVRPGTQLTPQTDFGAVIDAGSKGQEALFQRTMMSDAERAQTPEPSRTVEAGGVTADLFTDPAQLREWQARQKQARDSVYLNQRNAYLQLARDRFTFWKQNPREGQLQIAGGLPNIIAAHRTMAGVENQLPESANWAGMLKVIGETPLGRQFAPASTSMAMMSTAEQQYIIAMHRFLSEYFPAKGGKVLSENEVRQYFPVISATGFSSREAIQAVQEARKGNINQVAWQSGPAILQLLRSGQLGPDDLPPGQIEAILQLYGGNAAPTPSAGVPGPLTPAKPTNRLLQ